MLFLVIPDPFRVLLVNFHSFSVASLTGPTRRNLIGCKGKLVRTKPGNCSRLLQRVPKPQLRLSPRPHPVKPHRLDDKFPGMGKSGGSWSYGPWEGRYGQSCGSSVGPRRAGMQYVCWRRLSAGDVFSVSLLSGRPEVGVDTGHAPRQTAGRHAGHMEVYQIAHFKVIYHFLSVFSASQLRIIDILLS